MLIQAKQVIEFTCQEAGEFFGQVFTTKGKGAVEEIPDWILKHSYYALAVTAEMITELERGVKRIIDAESVANPDPVVTPDPSPITPDQTEGEQEEQAVDDGTLDVKSLAAKLGLTISTTKGILKEQYQIDAANGSYVLPSEVFDAVIASQTATA